MVENTRTGFWPYSQRSPGRLPTAPLYQILTWVLEQLNLGNVEHQTDSSGEVVSLKLGRGIKRYASFESASEETRKRLLAVNVAGIMAKARESGIEPKHASLLKRVTQEITDWGQRNTEFHYAFELTKVLARLNKKIFGLVAPPIAGMAPPAVVSYLRESTRCWLYGFHGASVALNRACLEEALRSRLGTNGELDVLIRWARGSRVLDDVMARVADTVRKAGNSFLHGKAVTENEARVTLEATRSIVEILFSE